MAYWAKESKGAFFTTGSVISGSEAVDIGLFNRAFPPEKLADAVTEYAAKLARVPPDLLALEKYAINRTEELRGFRQAMLQSVEINVTAHQTDAVHETNHRIKRDGLKATVEAFRRGEIGG